MFGINPGEFAVLLLVALIVVGPERLPKYAQHLGRLVREGRRMAMGLREQVRGELGPEFDDVDWTKLDPRQYDPRKIIRDALSENLEDEPKPVNDGGPKPADAPKETAAKDAAVDLQKKDAASRPGSAASPMAAAAKGGAGAAAAGATAAGAVGATTAATTAATADAGLTPEDAAAAKAAAAKPAPAEPEDFLAPRSAPTPFGTDDEQAPSVPAARTAGGAPVDLEAT